MKSGADEEQFLIFSDYQWATIEDNILTIGITDDGVDSITDITKVEIPPENTVIDADEVCGELDTRDGPMHLYCPVKGNLIEVNTAVIESPDLISEDPFGDGWLMRIEAEDIEELNEFIASAAVKGTVADDEDDEDDDYDDEDLDEDEEEHQEH